MSALKNTLLVVIAFDVLLCITCLGLTIYVGVDTQWKDSNMISGQSWTLSSNDRLKTSAILILMVLHFLIQLPRILFASIAAIKNHNIKPLYVAIISSFLILIISIILTVLLVGSDLIPFGLFSIFLNVAFLFVSIGSTKGRIETSWNKVMVINGDNSSSEDFDENRNNTNTTSIKSTNGHHFQLIT